ncbi:MAG: tRNA (adenosine(37)-N6)-dimethylallyltransferase MiaA [Flavobacteriales bacterium]|nr:tRNA (adenosine(37)-N6)-dimethylallyltransferase MiaA [Flavobacteriales bacterium]
MSTKGTLVVIGGPTASGKTHVAAALGKHFGTEVISADSRQFYRHMRIGTARPAEDELLGVPHHFLGHLAIEETWSAGAFARAAEPVLQRILAEHGIAVLVGGSGLYIDALLKGLDPLPAGQTDLRERLQEKFKLIGLESLLEQLQHLDPPTYERIDRNNPHRVIRALEICLATGRPYSEQRTTPKDRDDVRIIRVAMDLPRTGLYERIDARVDQMMVDGLLEEARALFSFRDHNALRTVGYTELFAHFDGQLELEAAVALIKQHTRNYAKRQMTWLRRDNDWRPMAPANTAEMIAAIEALRAS